MKDDWYKVIGLIIVTIVGGCGIGAALHLFVTLPVGAKGPEWLAASGTVATLSVTIWLATTESRRRRKNESLLAQLHGAAILNQVERAHQAVSTLMTGITFQSVGVTVDSNFFAGHVENFESLELWQMSDLIPLVALPHETAAKLAQANGHLKSLVPILKRAAAQWDAQVTSRSSISQQVLGRAAVLRLLLRDAEDVCRTQQVKVKLHSPLDGQRQG
ncbi:hypothetical protein [Massilia sp. CFBP9026]|uniref:hypothetical protein n=1 Tax=Massilia sp. CFBP9026 TaxID=3096536 RepID=UPI002A6B80FE|nr:hypothetical protein [Massilia sp. CFBP9026]MDY0964093.1 hypothetical protein [Massilia sp. CFBP9026]